MADVDLRLGDCLEVLPALADQSIDCICADPPYGVTSCRWDAVIPFEPMWAQLKRIIKPRGAIVLFGSQPFTSALVMSNVEWFKYSWVWEKTNSGDFMLAKHRPRMVHEDVVVFADGTPVYRPQMEQGLPYVDKPRKRTHNVINSTIPNLGIVNTGLRYPSSVQVFSNGNNDIEHPTQKPVALLEYLIRTYTNPGDTVLDFCFGSCTAGVACLTTGRNFIGIERDEEYFAVGQQRIHDAQYKIDLSPQLPHMEAIGA